MNSKGLSPLIATVLLIGITVSLAALVMVWGQALFKQTTENTGRTTTAEITCTSSVQVGIVNATCATTGPGGTPYPGNMSLIVDNQNEQPIYGLIVKAYGTGNSVQTIAMTLAAPLDAFNTKEYFVSYNNAIVRGGVTKVEIIPQIRLDNGELHACGQKVDSFVMMPAATTQCT